MPNRGKLVVLSFFFVALILAGGAIWYHFAKTRWAMAFWGAEGARLIVRADEVELLRLEAAPPSVESHSPPVAPLSSTTASLVVGEQTLAVADRKSITQAPGLIHMRMALVEDANFDIAAQVPAVQQWDYAFRFTGNPPDQSLVIAIDSRQGLVRVVGAENTRIAKITPIAKGLRTFLEEQFKASAEAGTRNAE